MYDLSLAYMFRQVGGICMIWVICTRLPCGICMICMICHVELADEDVHVLVCSRGITCVGSCMYIGTVVVYEIWDTLTTSQATVVVAASSSNQASPHQPHSHSCTSTPSHTNHVRHDNCRGRQLRQWHWGSRWCRQRAGSGFIGGSRRRTDRVGSCTHIEPCAICMI